MLFFINKIHQKRIIGNMFEILYSSCERTAVGYVGVYCNFRRSLIMILYTSGYIWQRILCLRRKFIVHTGYQRVSPMCYPDHRCSTWTAYALPRARVCTTGPPTCTIFYVHDGITHNDVVTKVSHVQKVVNLCFCSVCNCLIILLQTLRNVRRITLCQ